MTFSLSILLRHRFPISSKLHCLLPPPHRFHSLVVLLPVLAFFPCGFFFPSFHPPSFFLPIISVAGNIHPGNFGNFFEVHSLVPKGVVFIVCYFFPHAYFSAPIRHSVHLFCRSRPPPPFVRLRALSFPPPSFVRYRLAKTFSPTLYVQFPYDKPTPWHLAHV